MHNGACRMANCPMCNVACTIDHDLHKENHLERKVKSRYVGAAKHRINAG